MSPTLLVTIMACFLVYVIIRAVVYFRSGRPGFGIAVTFVACVVSYELIRQILAMLAQSSTG